MGDDAIAPMESGDITIAAMDHLDDAMVLEHEAEIWRSLSALSSKCNAFTVEDVKDIIEVPKMCRIAWHAVNLCLEEADMPVATEARALQINGEARRRVRAEAII